MREIKIQRPVTVEKLAVALGTRPYQIMSKLIRRFQFPSPHDAIADAVAVEVAFSVGVDLKIIDEGDGDGSEPVSSPVRPLIPPASTGEASRTTNAEQVAAARPASASLFHLNHHASAPAAGLYVGSHNRYRFPSHRFRRTSNENRLRSSSHSIYCPHGRGPSASSQAVR